MNGSFFDRLRIQLKRAIGRSDPRLAFGVGLAISLAVAGAFARRDVFPPADRLELLALDQAFRYRPPIPESELIAQVDLDDRTFRRIPWPVPRERYAQAVHALDRLGARLIVFDVEFKSVIPGRADYDPESGELRLTQADRALAFALARSGKALLAFHADLEDKLAPQVQAASDKLLQVFRRNPGADADEAARATGLDRALLHAELEAIREHFVTLAVAQELDREPALSFDGLRRRLLPAGDERLIGADLNLLQYAYGHWRSLRALETKASKLAVESRPSRQRRLQRPAPLHSHFLEAALGAGIVNAEADSDGVMRRPWAALFEGDRAYAYLGLEAAARLAGEAGRPAPITLHRDRLEVGNAVLPLDREGRLLLNWAGNRNASRRSGRPPFAHVPFFALLEYFEERYETLDANVRRTIAQIPAEDRPSSYGEYLQASDRLTAAFQGRAALPPAESRALEARMDAVRRTLVDDLSAELPGLDRLIQESAGKERLREKLQQQRGALAAQLGALQAPESRERALKALVAGRLCVIGSASTASGDLHSTPLGPSTPGMDVLANAANMVLTAQSIRRLPAGAEFAYLASLGGVLAWFVSRRSTLVSTALLAVLSLAAAAAFILLFAGAGLQIPGAGPVVVLLASFASATAFKELVTQRSKRKLQRELEKNTSPDLVNILLEHPELLSEPRKMAGTFFFSDIKSFTSISEKMTPEVLVPFINRYLDRMTQALKTHQGYLDKYIGDGIMALFGVPVASADHARSACLAALDCQAGLRRLNEDFAKEGLPLLTARIGIHTGEVIAGYVGAADRSDYTVLGDPVNLASRLEGANKEYGSVILISAATAELTGDLFMLRELDVIRVVGKRKPVRIYELVGRSGELPPFDPAFFPAWAAALAAFRERRWTEAAAGFGAAEKLKPGDKACELYIGRARQLQAAPPAADWDGVFELTGK